MDFCHQHNVSIKLKNEKKNFGIKVTLPLGDTLGNLLGENWSKQHWYDDENVIFVDKQRDLINSLKLDLSVDSKELNSCNIVANLTFGFWINLFNSVYDRTIWRQSLAKIFKYNGKIPKRGLSTLKIKSKNLFYML